MGEYRGPQQHGLFEHFYAPVADFAGTVVGGINGVLEGGRQAAFPFDYQRRKRLGCSDVSTQERVQERISQAQSYLERRYVSARERTDHTAQALVRKTVPFAFGAVGVLGTPEPFLIYAGAVGADGVREKARKVFPDIELAPHALRRSYDRESRGSQD